MLESGTEQTKDNFYGRVDRCAIVRGRTLAIPINRLLDAGSFEPDDIQGLE
jgi:hypothetical protein